MFVVCFFFHIQILLSLLIDPDKWLNPWKGLRMPSETPVMVYLFIYQMSGVKQCSDKYDDIFDWCLVQPQYV